MPHREVRDGFTEYRFGESAVMPKDRPFHWACGDTVYALTHSIDDDGRIRMAVDVDSEETDRLRQLAADRASLTDRSRSTVTLQDSPQHRGRPSNVLDERDAAAYDERGILRDGHGIRIRMPAMDAANNSGLIGTGTPDDPIVIETGLGPRRKRRRGQFRDPYGKEGGTFEESDHRPGFRDADRSASETARAQMIHDQANAWRGPEQQSQNETSVSDACPAGVDPREWALELNIRETRDAWMKPPPVLDAGPEVFAPTKTRAMEDLPPGRFPMSAGVGSPCDLNGERGTLQPDGSGYLVCKVTQRVGPTRSSEPVKRADSMDAAQAQVIRDQAYKTYCADLESAWRST